ncbi:MAG: hypothetical protein U5L45_16230 [Saprospiraceae bacterium]|nr:hypothetical protein [Saprospiraceae bacterium]
MVHFSGFARKMNHLSSFYASEASAKCLLMRILNLCMVSNTCKKENWFALSNSIFCNYLTKCLLLAQGRKIGGLFFGFAEK